MYGSARRDPRARPLHSRWMMPGPGQVLLETEATLLRPRPGAGFRAEVALGRILAMGSPVDGVGAGDRVLFAGGHAARELRGVTGPGSLVKVPDGVAGLDLLMASLFRRAQRVRRSSTPHVGVRVAVLGLDLLGVLLAQLYQRSGARVFALCAGADELDLGRAAGVPAYVHTDRAQVKQLARGPEGGPVHVAVAAGAGAACVLDCLSVCRPRGQLLLVDPPDTDDADALELLRLVHFRCLRVRTVPRWEPPSRHTAEEAVLRALEDMAGAGLTVPSIPRLRPGERPDGAPAAALVDWARA
jgi:NADPH:quinone reductase-like Zn-dependent oxidoreductase